ncbi:MAG: NfeD family protein [Lachnospiraceae bacterium]|nr:NfeD family protein [Lachnospiraceae bacterium]
MAFVADLSMTVFWLIVLVALVIIELLTMGLTTVWFAGGALVATVAALFHAPLFLQIILFLVVSALLLFFTRPLAVKYFNKDRVRTNAESLVGRQAIVISEIDNLQGIGQVNVGGMEWSARTRVDGVRLPVGTVTTVLAINGVKLVVEERKEV